MNTTFHDSHLDTLIKLKALVEKHGMKIRFGTRDENQVEANVYLLDDFVDKEILETLSDNYYEITNGEVILTDETLWFELYEEMPGEKYPKYHSMTYTERNVSFKLEIDWREQLEYISHYKDDYSDEYYESFNKLIDFISENNYNDIDVVVFSKQTTTIRGFGNKEPITDGRVYREGMALHFFTELVCNYLKEPMINNTY